MKHTIGLMLSGLAATILFCACTASPESVAVKISQDESEELSILAETTVTMTQQTIQTTTTTERKPDLVEEVPAEHVLDVDAIYQRPELPTGCEVTSLTALLQYLGFDVDKTFCRAVMTLPRTHWMMPTLACRRPAMDSAVMLRFWSRRRMLI